MKVTVHHSDDIDAIDAIAEIMEECAAEWTDASPDAGIFFSAHEHDFEAIQSAVMARWPELQLIGCSGNGQISSAQGPLDDSITLMLFGSQRVRFAAGVGRNVTEDPEGAARQAMEQAMAGESEPPALCILLSESHRVNIARVLVTAQETLGMDTLLVGGLADVYTHAEPTKQGFRGEALTNSVVCLCLFGPVACSAATRSGMRPVGKKHRITSATGPYVHTIDDRPAVKLWEDYMGHHSIWFPLAVFPEDDGLFYLAATPSTTEDGSAYFFNPIPNGAVVSLADVTQEEIIAGTAEAVERAVAGFTGDRVDAAVVFSCSGRKGMLGTRVQEELDVLRSSLDARIPISGFYSAGELCPLDGQKITRDHGFTFVTVLIGES